MPVEVLAMAAGIAPVLIYILFDEVFDLGENIAFLAFAISMVAVGIVLAWCL